MAFLDARGRERVRFTAGAQPRPKEIARAAAMLRPALRTTANVSAPARIAPRPRARRPVSSRGPPTEDDSEEDHGPVAARPGLSTRTTTRCIGCGGEFSPRGPRARFCARCLEIRKAGFSAGWVAHRERQVAEQTLDAVACDDKRERRGAR